MTEITRRKRTRWRHCSNRMKLTRGPYWEARTQEALHNRAAPFRWRLVVMAKMPVAGGVKTRLARQVGVTSATRLARQVTAALLQRLAFDRRWQTTIAITPDRGLTSRCWPRRLSLVPQGAGDLGVRMQRIFERTPPGPVLIVGTDIPRITPSQIAEAFALLGRHDAVFGPATDGGYWLVGSKRRPRVLAPFSHVRWSSRHALADTLANLQGRAVAFVATLSDVDDARDFSSSAAYFGRRVLPSSLLTESKAR